MNNFKTVIFLSVLTGLLIMVGGAIGGQSGMIMAFMFACIINFGSWWFSDKIVLKMYHAKEIEKKDSPDLFAIIEEVAKNAGLPMPKVYVIEQNSPNAFATGRDPSHAAVAVTTGIMNILTIDELKGVIAHELAHIKNHDTLIASIAATIAGAISMLASIARWGLIFGGGMGGRNKDDRNSNPIAGIIVMILAPIAAMLVQMAISRSREFEADKDGAGFSGNPKLLASALRKLEAGVTYRPMIDANPSTAHLFIVNPLRGGSFLKLFSTHPPMDERIARLESMS